MHTHTHTHTHTPAHTHTYTHIHAIIKGGRYLQMLKPIVIGFCSIGGIDATLGDRCGVSKYLHNFKEEK